MKLTVSLRVFGGFTSLLLLSTILFVVAIMGISSIGKDLENIAEQSVPTLLSGTELSQSILAIELTLNQLSTSDRIVKAEKYKKEFVKYTDHNQLVVKELSGYIDELPQVKSAFNDARKLNNEFLKIAKHTVVDYFKVLALMEQSSELKSEFGDMGDETLSLAYDIDGLSNDSDMSTKIETLVTVIENIVDTANAGMASTNVFAVMNTQSELNELVAELSELFDQVSQAPDIAGGEEITTLSENLVRFKSALVGGSSAIAVKIKSLQQKKRVDKELAETLIKGELAREHLLEINEKISHYTKETEAHALASVTRTKFITSILAVITLILSITVAYFVMNSIRKPLNHAVEQIKRAAKGDMTVSFTKFRDDELGELADNMQLLVNSLRKTLKEISNNSQTLATTAEQTSTITEQSFHSVSQQSEQMQTMSNSISEMSETVDSVTASIHNTLEQVEKANSDATKGEELLLANVENIYLLEQAIEKSANVIEKLNEDTNNISSVLDVIRGVAEQTNLLALNAAIEAARAGEQGRGFAVVADEVRTLASKAQDSTQEIQQAIERLQVGAKQAVETMGQSQEETHSCVNGINSVKSMLESIVSGITNIRDMSQQIATASEEQSLAAKSQYQNVIEIQEITELSASRAKENQQASQQLAEMAETQRELMCSFKT